MRHIFQLMVITYLLVGCSGLTSRKSIQVVTTDFNEYPKIILPNIIPQLPKIKRIDWLNAILPLTNQLVQTPVVKSNKVILLDTIKNNTNMSIQLMPVINAIINAVNNKNVFKFVPQDVLMHARKNLGLSQEDSLVTRSKAIGLARYVQADYVLYSIISGNKEEIEIEMQLIGAQSGEIFWLGKNSIK